jgi:lysophospholipase L1-like esterase
MVRRRAALSLITRAALWLLAAAVALVAIIGVEILLALRREYLPTEPAMELGGTFGSPDGRPLRFVVLGDSTAVGVGAGEPRRAYPTLLAQRLAARGRRVELTVFGASGARVEDVLTEQVPRAEQIAPDLVFVGIGANDAIHVTALDSIRGNISEAIQRLKSVGAAVVVAGAPDMRAAAWHEPLRSLAGWRGQQVADVIEAAARASEVDVVELAEKTGPFFAADPEAHYADDDFHPGPGGYRRWADAIYPQLERALAEEGQ